MALIFGNLPRLFGFLGTAEYVGLDTETLGCDPSRQSPIGHARIWCLTLADERFKAFIPGEQLHELKPWLEGNTPKVGHGVLDYDIHVLVNHGIRLRGILGDTLHMSRLWNTDETFQHGAKSWAERLNIPQMHYVDIAGRRAIGREIRPAKDRTSKGAQYVEQAPYCNLLKGRRLVPLDILWDEEPGCRGKLIQYATQDAYVTYKLYGKLRSLLGFQSIQ